MCTVTYIPNKSGYYLTSNRDEHETRGEALPPTTYVQEKTKLLYPSDPDKKGTWIAIKENGDLAVLLNGAFVKHERATYYRRSRGLVLLDILGQESPVFHFQEMNLNGIEPFTLILIIATNLYECRWDGQGKRCVAINKYMPHIWSSATLYDASATTTRQNWFQNFLSDETPKTSKAILDFHQTAGGGDSQNGLIINRNNGIKTRSITHVRSVPGRTKMTYRNLTSQTEYEKDLAAFDQIKPATTKIGNYSRFMALRRLWIKITHWEYWPFNVVYAPIIIYWLWLGLKARSFFFFSTANPSIENGGFAMESKKKIYDLIPKQYYPRTLFFRCGTNFNVVTDELVNLNFEYPLIAKPDIGGRGVQVKLVHNAHELSDYVKQIKVDYLVQEYVIFQNEIGVFYYRMPGDPVGQISGIVGKGFLTITGDGVSSVEKLVVKEPRYLLQLPVLQKTEAEQLKKILPYGEKLILVPYGNHARGAKFIDLSHKITPRLNAVIDHVCRQVPDFYFGRLDLMYRDWESLEQGKDFSIVELNGAGSEPTHIYDPSHSIFFAWREIIRHWRLLYRISRINKANRGLKDMSYSEGVVMLKKNSAYQKLVA